MPIGIIINVSAVILGGILGAFLGQGIPDDFKEKLNMIFGASAMTMGVYSIVLMVNMPAVIFSVIAGTVLGMVIHLGSRIEWAAQKMVGAVSRFLPNTSSLPKEDFDNMLITVIVLFCASGTGIYGSIVSGMSGDHSILISKAILDLPTSLIFGCMLGIIVAFIAIPQFIIFIILFLLAGIIFPLTTPAMVNDFKACGGVLLLATGFRMLKLKNFPVADMIPAMAIVMPVSWFWVSYILPLVS